MFPETGGSLVSLSGNFGAMTQHNLRKATSQALEVKRGERSLAFVAIAG
ncbi:hypothetical protein ACFPU1_00615 [Thalassorhabdus alkalitolerans]|uniref:Uncharacterized protein n=1 Tax=Thalassorhabdus alkalitolerans TaxID=2282697 RepID=A0ABW0YMF2_9BACI